MTIYPIDLNKYPIRLNKYPIRLNKYPIRLNHSNYIMFLYRLCKIKIYNKIFIYLW